MDKIDWATTLIAWMPSPGAVPVTEEAHINLIANFCKYVGVNFWDKIELFEGDPLASKKQISDDGLSKNTLFEEASVQILDHRKVWKVQQKKHPKRQTYEFPFVANLGGQLRYMKFQIEEGMPGLSSPSRVGKVWLRYHVSDQKIEVKYVEN